MRENRQQVLEWMGVSEGGYVNHPSDPGGATNHGVTQRTYNAWRDMQGLARRSVRDLDKAEADEIFVANYMKPVKFDDLPAGLDYAMADFSVNSGPSRAVRELQAVLTGMGHPMSVDGNMGPVTLSAALSVNAADAVRRLCRRRMDFLRRLKHWPTFGKGWTRRVMGEQDGVQAGDTGVIDRGVRMAEGRTVTGGPKPAPGKATGDPISGIVAIIMGLLEMIARALGKKTPQP